MKLGLLAALSVGTMAVPSSPLEAAEPFPILSTAIERARSGPVLVKAARGASRVAEAMAIAALPPGEDVDDE